MLIVENNSLVTLPPCLYPCTQQSEVGSVIWCDGFSHLSESFESYIIETMIDSDYTDGMCSWNITLMAVEELHGHMIHCSPMACSFFVCSYITPTVLLVAEGSIPHCMIVSGYMNIQLNQESRCFDLYCLLS